jgi:hypothetical protein
MVMGAAFSVSKCSGARFVFGLEFGCSPRSIVARAVLTFSLAYWEFRTCAADRRTGPGHKPGGGCSPLRPLHSTEAGFFNWHRIEGTCNIN